MKTFLKILTGLTTLLLLLLAVKHIFMPEATAAESGLSLLNANGFSSFSGAFGGLFLAVSCYNILGLMNNEKIWLYASALIMVAAAIARSISAVSQSSTAGITHIVVELVLAAIYFLTAKKLES